MIRAAVVYSEPRGSNLEEIAQAIAQELGTRQGVKAEVLTLEQAKERRLSGYHYIAFGVAVTSWFKGHLPEDYLKDLGACGLIGGKKAFAFVPSSILGAQKTLSNLMEALESEGVFLRFSQVLKDSLQARETAAGLKID